MEVTIEKSYAVKLGGMYFFPSRVHGDQARDLGLIEPHPEEKDVWVFTNPTPHTEEKEVC